jgi:hypothetical protein
MPNLSVSEMRRPRLLLSATLQLLLATLCVGSSLGADPPRMGILLDVDKSASTVDCRGEILSYVTAKLSESRRVVPVEGRGEVGTWEEFAAANDLPSVTVISIERCTVKFGGQIAVGRSTSNVFKANTDLRVRIMDVASGTAVMDQQVKGKASVKEPVSGIPLIDGVMFAVEASKGIGGDDKKQKQTDEYAQKYETTLLDSVAKATRKLGKFFLEAMPVRGLLTSVEAKTASLDVGENWGITKKNKFVIYRPAVDGGDDLELGVLGVQSVSGNTTVLKGSKKVLATLKAGDSVRSK